MEQKLPSMPPEWIEYFRTQGSKGGKIGGKRLAQMSTPEERVARAKKAAAAAAIVHKAKAKARKAARKSK